MKIKPDYIADELVAITPGFLKEIGAAYILIDLDNTLVPRKSNHIDEDIKRWLYQLKKEGISVYLVSNSLHKRARELADALGVVDFIAPAGKPFLTRIKKFLKKHRIPGESAVFIGDQLFTDIYLSRRLGLKSVWVMPLAGGDPLHTRILRAVERLLLLKWKKRNEVRVLRSGK